MKINRKWITASIILAVLFVLIIYKLDSLPTNDLVNSIASNIFTIRESTLNFLFRVAPFFITVIIAISSLTLNTYSGTFLNILLSDKSINFFILFSLFYLCFHTTVIFVVDPSNNSLGNQMDVYYVNHFIIFTFDFILAAFNAALTLYTTYKVFAYSRPLTLKENFYEI